MFLDEDNQTHYIGSNTKQQVRIIFDELVSIIRSSPNMAPLFTVKKTYVEFTPKNCKLVALSGDAQRADGTMVFCASVDELGADNNIFKMVSSLETGAFGPRNPLIVKISTSYPIENDFNYWNDTVEGLRATRLLTFLTHVNSVLYSLLMSQGNVLVTLRDGELPKVWPES